MYFVHISHPATLYMTVLCRESCRVEGNFEVSNLNESLAQYWPTKSIYGFSMSLCSQTPQARDIWWFPRFIELVSSNVIIPPLVWTSVKLKPVASGQKGNHTDLRLPSLNSWLQWSRGEQTIYVDESRPSPSESMMKPWLIVVRSLIFFLSFQITASRHHLLTSMSAYPRAILLPSAI